MAEDIRTRVMVLIAILISIFSLSLVFALWMGITPSDLTGFTVEDVPVINATTVYIPTAFVNTLQSRYESDSVEFIYCFYGKLYEAGYKVEKMEETQVIQAENDMIMYKPCKRQSNYLGTIHSHPPPDKPRYVATCKLSTQDIYTFGAEQMPLTGVICGSGEGKIAVYGIGNFEKSYKIEKI